jgi:hypothetical protein
MSEHEHDETDDADDGDKHPLTEVKNPFEDEREKAADGDDDAWVPPVP